KLQEFPCFFFHAQFDCNLKPHIIRCKANLDERFIDYKLDILFIFLTIFLGLSFEYTFIF
ncbi:MAG TPA: hypothetical protein VJL78_04460, partial [Candidatus Nitrosocosmicus sp.]|nr:hypothetical protein [Candidatus Nitrosocosmicus sp.]